MSKIILYNQSRDIWTDAGNAYLMKILIANPYPSTQEKQQIIECTGVTEKQLNGKLCKIRERKLYKIQEEIQAPPQEEISASIALLNSLTLSQAEQIYEEMKCRMKLIDYINPQHLKPTLTVEKLKKMIGDKYGDGAHFVKWMSCLISAQNILTPNYYPQLTLGMNVRQYRCIGENIKNICKKYNKSNIYILKHHIALRTKQAELSALSSTGMTASHLCDTPGCISKHHIIEESFEVNNARRLCDGIRLTLWPATATTPAKIVKATACEHGVSYTSIEDQLNFSCRKIKIVELDEVSVAFFNKIKK